MAHVGRLRLKGVSFSRFRYMKGLGTFSFIQMFKRALIKIFQTLIPDDCSFLIYWMQHENDKKISCLEVIRKGYHLSMKGTRKGYLFCKKWYINKRVRVRHLGADPPILILFRAPPRPGLFAAPCLSQVFFTAQYFGLIASLIASLIITIIPRA